MAVARRKTLLAFVSVACVVGLGAAHDGIRGEGGNGMKTYYISELALGMFLSS